MSGAARIVVGVGVLGTIVWASCGPSSSRGGGGAGASGTAGRSGGAGTGGAQRSCQGTPAPCFTQPTSETACEVQLGCAFVEERCEGTPTPCDTFSSALCAVQLGCFWSGSSLDGKCIGVPRPCPQRMFVCEAVAGSGCRLEGAHCDGEATACARLLSSEQCAEQVGCAWRDVAPSGMAGTSGGAGNAGVAGTTALGAAGNGAAGTGAAGTAAAGRSGSGGVSGTAGTGAAGTSAGAAAKLTTPTREHPFGMIYVGNEGTAWTVPITNAGMMETSELKTGFMGGNTKDFIVVSDSCAGTKLAGGATCQVVLNAKPTNGTTILESFFRIVGAPGGTVELYVRTEALARPVLNISPFVQDFGKGPFKTLGTPATMPAVLTVKNVGGPTPAAPVVTITGADATSFRLTSNQCALAPLPAGETCTIEAAFYPFVSVGAKEALLSVSSLEANTLAALRGTATSKVSVSITGTGTGQIYSEPLGINCPDAACTADFSTPVTLTIVVYDDSKLISLTGCPSATVPCQLALDAPTKAITMVVDRKP